ncbi:hypothetical protein Geob_0997 [Geotalea daltonii FRC-32]|uniref:Uncharacterized protein n=1 Tax=Geotalea daltonii (strain DSM 22248 / JCM 15807 / FRC-32) TaxID=316067 RepID=B9M2I0_GEODF|nr:hypothetical protein [Geotalea daltonii]ACM19359.1 hypothetical protein Geob_0997 [Geotalea daltonii FRC-32]
MYFWKTRLLEEDLKRNSINETGFKNYYMGTSVLTTICFYLAMLQPPENMQALATESLVTLIITIVGINAAFKANGGGTGSRFIEKAVSLSFPLLIKVMVAGLVVGVVIGVLEMAGTSKFQLEWGTTISIIAIEAVFYWRLVAHIKRTA